MYLLMKSYDAARECDYYAIVPLDEHYVSDLIDIYNSAQPLFEKEGVLCVDVRCERVYWFSSLEDLWNNWVYETVSDNYEGVVVVPRIPKALSEESLHRRSMIVHVEYPHYQIFPKGYIKWDAFHACTDDIIYTVEELLSNLAKQFDLEIQTKGDEYAIQNS